MSGPKPTEIKPKPTQNTLITVANILDFFKKNSLTFVLFIYLIIIAYFASIQSSIVYSKSYLYGVIVLAPILIVASYLYKDTDSKGLSFTVLQQNWRTILGIVVFVGAIIGLSSFIDAQSDMVQNLSHILFVAIAIVAALVVAKAFKIMAYSMEGVPGIIARILVFIPCMISDAFTYIVGQFATSPTSVYALLLLEAALIAAYVFLPRIIQSANKADSHQIVNKPVILNQATTMKTISPWYSKSGDEYKTNQSNTVSMWVYLVNMPDSQAPYHKETDIFKLGDDNKRLTYLGGKVNKCRLHYMNGDENAKTQYVEFAVPVQKWVHLAIVSKFNSVDVFVNGELAKTASLGPNTVKFSATDNIVVGTENGVHGGICNLVYYPRWLPKMEITRLYERYKDMETPIDI